MNILRVFNFKILWISDAIVQIIIEALNMSYVANIGNTCNCDVIYLISKYYILLNLSVLGLCLWINDWFVCKYYSYFIIKFADSRSRLSDNK